MEEEYKVGQYPMIERGIRQKLLTQLFEDQIKALEDHQQRTSNFIKRLKGEENQVKEEQVIFSEPSWISEVIEKKDMIYQWLGGKKMIYLELVMRKSQSLDDNLRITAGYSQSPTITFIKSTKGQVFGFYLSIVVGREMSMSESQNGYMLADPDAFIFSLSKGTKHEQFRFKNCAVSSLMN